MKRGLDLSDRITEGIVTKVRSLKTGRTIGGIPFTRGPLAHLLRNRFYVGEVAFKGEVLPGEQPAILDRDLFDAVQAKLNDQRTNRTAARAKSESLLIGRIYDDRGNRMSPSHVRKLGGRYRYYVSSPLLHGQAGRAGSVRRVPAAEVEALVGRAVREHLEDSTQTDDRDLVSTHIVRVEVQTDQLAVELKAPKQTRGRGNGTPRSHEASEQDADHTILLVPWQKTPSKRRREIIVPKSATPQDARPIRAETRAKLVASIARGRRWLDEIATGTVTRANRRARKMQRPQGQHDDLARVSRTGSRQSGDRRPPAARTWSCPSLRLPGRVVASVPDARPSKPLAGVSPDPTHQPRTRGTVFRTSVLQ